MVAISYQILSMKTIAEIRRNRLEQLIAQHGSIANLNIALSWPRTDPKLAQIRNANTRPGRDKPYQMGDAMARDIEEKLGLEHGWMDNTPDAYEPHGDMRIATIVKIMEAMPEWQRDQAVKIVTAIAEPTPQKTSNGH